MRPPVDNLGCRAQPQLDVAAGHLGTYLGELAAAGTPSEALAAVARMEVAVREAREWLAVDLVLDEGWSYADVARPLGITRQAASKAYAGAVHARMRRKVLGRDDMLVIVGCGSAKRDRPAPAGRMYTGSYHAACRRAADAIGGRLLILSARYGLISLDTWIEPYELRLGQAGAVTVPRVRAQARQLGIDTAGTVTVLAGAGGDLKID
ncbi:DUF6884 domain-containing protein, partial [Actinoplanes philippinensis]|uniref:DUF6884 domain-containing protein n=1 Tax=Actinoplanes philippinensis TaxID=35752 RepID=UPI0033F0013F